MDIHRPEFRKLGNRVKAGKYDITIEQGSGLGITVSFQPGGEQVDWTGCDADFKHGPSTALRTMSSP